MTMTPILTPWLFWPLSVLLLAAAVLLVWRNRSSASWRYAALVVLLILAGMRPGLTGATAPVANTELNVFFVVDMTPSSSAEDYNSSSPRLTGMKTDIMALADELSGARFSLITFDSEAKVALPLTTDATALRTLTQVMAPRSAFASHGSSISVADEVLAQRLTSAEASHPERPRLVYYLGDGEQTAATAPEPFTEATALIDGGAVLGYGSTAGAKMRDYSFGTDKPGPYILDKSADYAPALSRIDEKSLNKIASQLNVPYIHRTGPGSISGALIKSAPHAASKAPAHADREGAGRWEVYWIFALAAFAVVLWELAALTRAWRQLPRPEKGAP
ncbi:VWA domain-containing protein [Arthrobacter antibioticus]|uniref:VWA domain-containing protein n=1 Tax=Arthrobacter sp. H35-MC1 TaxID=3046203 RepID=UPI0024BAE020|nr:VWA domain-containing protein [Arthrobacter sp. H35-MC1]MDJ0315977.1 VWA domain-containing protein [Arthrobacter sp. H35-MC1]